MHFKQYADGVQYKFSSVAKSLFYNKLISRILSVFAFGIRKIHTISDSFVSLTAPAIVGELPAVYQVRCTITGFPQGNSVSRTVDIDVRHPHADLDVDGDTDMDDLSLLAEQWLTLGEGLIADISQVEKDNTVNMKDFVEFSRGWMAN